jgi:hypothetical protein
MLVLEKRSLLLGPQRDTVRLRWKQSGPTTIAISVESHETGSV